MKKLIAPVFAALLASALLCPPETRAEWMGFDSDSADLALVVTDTFPRRGQILTVTDVDGNNGQDCLVVGVHVNGSTVELQVTTPDGKERLLVMPPF